MCFSSSHMSLRNTCTNCFFFLFYNFLCITDCETVSLHFKSSEMMKITVPTKQGSQIQNHSSQYFQRDCLMDFVYFEIFSEAPCWTENSFPLPVFHFPFFALYTLDMECCQENWNWNITYKDSKISGRLHMSSLPQLEHFC